MKTRGRTDKEIENLLEQCFVAEDLGKSKYRGMTYEQGIKAAINWLFDTGHDSEHPLDD